MKKDVVDFVLKCQGLLACESTTPIAKRVVETVGCTCMKIGMCDAQFCHKLYDSNGSWQGGGYLAYFMALCIFTFPVFFRDLCIVTHMRACPKLYMTLTLACFGVDCQLCLPYLCVVIFLATCLVGSLI